MYCSSRGWFAGASACRRAAARVGGEDSLDNLVIIVVFLIAIAQALTILLTIRREGDIRELDKLVKEQRLQVVELKAWLGGRNAAQPRLTKSEREPTSEPIANNAKESEPASTPRGLAEPLSPNPAVGDAAQMMKVLNWQREIIGRLRAELKAAVPPEPAITPKELADTPSPTENEFERTTNVINWLKQDIDSAREINSHSTPSAKKIG
jgi:hypothetical protein